MLIALSLVAGIITPQEGPPLALRKEELVIRVQDQVARATVDDVFENSTSKALEGRYALPLPDGAAVSGFAVWVDGQRVESRMETKQAAQQAFDEAQAAHRAPALLEESDAHTFHMRVDGIPAGGTKRVETAWAQILPYDAGLVTLRVPFPQVAAGSFHLRVEGDDQKQIAEVKVLSPAGMTVSRTKSGGFVAEFAGQPPPELVLTYRTESSRLGLSFIPFKPASEDGYFLLLASPQELTREADIVHKDVVFVFDTSGSMTGVKISQARAALKRCLSNLNREDRFSIVAFSDALNPYSNALLPASAENVHKALSFADGLDAAGGTNIDGALQAALAMQAESERPRVIVFMTDGVPTSGLTDPPLIAGRFRERNAGATRLFTFGVGEDVNRVFLEQLASENRGATGFVANGADLDAIVGGFYAKIARPVLSDLSLDFGKGVTVSMQYPDVLPDLYKGSQLVLTGRYRGAGKAQAALSGTLNGKKLRIPFAADFPAANEENTFVARVWAEKRIEFLLASMRLHGEQKEAKDEVVALSLRYRIVTPFTSLVAVQSTQVAQVFPARVRPGDPLVLIRAPQDSLAVSVRLPWSDAEIPARWDEQQQAFVARFLVPADTADGSYPIAVSITHRDGRLERVALSIGIDTHAPSLAVWASAARAGGLVSLRAVATVGLPEIARTMLTRPDVPEGLKALFDVRRVTARLWDGREVELALDPRGLGFTAQVETDRTLAPGSYPVTVVAQDFAGNSALSHATVEVLR